MKAYNKYEVDEIFSSWQSDLDRLDVIEVYTKSDMVVMLTELKKEIYIMSNAVVEGRTVTITSWEGMQKRICKLIQSKIDKLEGNA